LVGQAILPAAAFQAALALWGSFVSCSADFIGALRAALPARRGRLETGCRM
jgi:hypothetical protein